MSLFRRSSELKVVWPREGAFGSVLGLTPGQRGMEAKVRAFDATRYLLVIRCPIYKGESFVGEIGSKMIFSYTDARGQHYIPAVLAKLVEEDVPMWVLQVTGSSRTKQLRNHVRVQTIGEMSLLHNGMSKKATMLDISEGGMRCAVLGQEKIVLGDIVTVSVNLGSEMISCHAKVVRVDSRDPRRVELGTQFQDIEDRDREFIRKYLFELQLKERKLRQIS